MNFFKSLLASILGFFIALFIIIFLFGIMITSIAGSAFSKESNFLTSKSVLELDLSKPIKDFTPNFGELEKLMDNEMMSLSKIINAIERAKTDDNIEGISIKTSMVNAGIAQTQAIRDKIIDFKKSGKFVYAYNDSYDQKNYYLSSVADSLYLNPVGQIDFSGLSAEILFFKDFEEKYGIKMEVIRHGKYKSAVEPFLNNKMSPANREQTLSFLNSIWSKMTEDISQNRKISVEKLNEIADNSLGRNAKLSKENNLIDAIIYEDQYKAKLEGASEEGEVHFIKLSDYINTDFNPSTERNTNIAVIYAQGDIIYGKGNPNHIGQELTIEAIHDAVEDDDVKAIVLRVNSPGGSALTSELIWRELELAKNTKPIVVSMGNYAASGGYYISCNATKIFAEPTTITGSIGVFGVLPNAYQFSERIGINAEQVSTNKSPKYSVLEPLNQKFYEVTKEGVEDIYKTFVNRVATGRKMTYEQVDAIAQGRVWSGKEALKNGLVDELGGLDDAIEYAAELVQIDNYGIKNLPKYEMNLKSMLRSSPYIKVSKDEILKDALGDENYRLYKNIHDMKSLKGIQAKLPYVINIK